MKTATLNELRRVYLTASKMGDLNVSPRYAKSNFNKLKKIMAPDAEPPELLTQVKPDFLKRWKDFEYTKAGETQNRATINYRLNSRLRQAQSVFCKKALAIYENEGLRIPQYLIEFATAQKFTPEARQSFRPIPEHIDNKIRSEARKGLENPGNEALLPPLGFVMVEMARLAGMTAKEIHFFDKSWVIKTNRGYVIDIHEDGAFTTKHSTKNRQIPISANVWHRWEKYLPDSPAPFGKWKQCTSPQSLYNKVNKWLNNFIPERQKKLHELRKMACSEVLENERDIYAAAYFIGDRVDTTVKYYAAQIRRIKPLE